MLQQWLCLNYYVENFTYLFTHKTYRAARFLLSRAVSCVPQYLTRTCSTFPSPHSTDRETPSTPWVFPLLPWGWGVGITGPGPPLKLIPSAQTTSFGCTPKTPLALLSIHRADVTDQQKELSHDHGWQDKSQIWRPKYIYTNTYFLRKWWFILYLQLSAW